jgi:hypothetical protein
MTWLKFLRLIFPSLFAFSKLSTTIFFSISISRCCYCLYIYRYSLDFLLNYVYKYFKYLMTSTLLSLLSSFSLIFSILYYCFRMAWPTLSWLSFSWMAWTICLYSWNPFFWSCSCCAMTYFSNIFLANSYRCCSYCILLWWFNYDYSHVYIKYI